MRRHAALLVLMALLLAALTSLAWATPCARCKTELGANAKFCANCGAMVRVKQRYEGTFPVIIYGGPFVPPGQDPDSDTTKAWQRQFLQTVKGLGFNGVGGQLSSYMISEAEKLGMCAVPGGNYAPQFDNAALTAEQAGAAVKPAAELCAGHRNVIAVVAHADQSMIKERKEIEFTG